MGAIARGIKIAGTIFAVLSLVTPSWLVPIKKIISEPVADIYPSISAGRFVKIKVAKRVKSP